MLPLLCCGDGKLGIGGMAEGPKFFKGLVFTIGLLFSCCKLVCKAAIITVFDVVRARAVDHYMYHSRNLFIFYRVGWEWSAVKPFVPLPVVRDANKPRKILRARSTPRFHAVIFFSYFHLELNAVITCLA